MRAALYRLAVRDLLGKYSFSNDVIFNEKMPACLGVPRPIPSSIPDASTLSSARPLRDRPHIRTTAGKAYDAVMELKQFRRDEWQRKVLKNAAVNGGVSCVELMLVILLSMGVRML